MDAEAAQVDESIGAVALHRHDGHVTPKVPGVGAADGQAVPEAGERGGGVEVRGWVVQVHEALRVNE